MLYFEGTPADRIYVVEAGRVRLYKASSNGHITTLDVLGPGEVFGALAPLEQDTYPASAEVVQAGSAWYLPSGTFARILGRYVREEHVTTLEEAVRKMSSAVAILRILSRRLRHAHERLRAFAHDPAPARLAQVLLEAAREGSARVTRRALAESAGTTVETAIRVLRRFERAGLINGSVGEIEVLDAEGLGRIASGDKRS